jgi:hypothetical protein
MMAPILHRFARHAWRGVVLVVGLVLIAAGLVMIVTPGPGIAAILAGLALLSTEFAWAKRLLNWFRRRFAAASAEVRRRATHRSRRPTPEPEPAAGDGSEASAEGEGGPSGGTGSEPGDNGGGEGAAASSDPESAASRDHSARSHR